MVQCAARQPVSAYSDALREGNSADRVGGVMLLALGGRECHRPLGVLALCSRNHAPPRAAAAAAQLSQPYAIILQSLSYSICSRLYR